MPSFVWYLLVLHERKEEVTDSMGTLEKGCNGRHLLVCFDTVQSWEDRKPTQEERRIASDMCDLRYRVGSGDLPPKGRLRSGFDCRKNCPGVEVVQSIRVCQAQGRWEHPTFMHQHQTHNRSSVPNWRDQHSVDKRLHACAGMRT